MKIRMTFTLDDDKRLAIGRALGNRVRPANRSQAIQYVAAVVAAYIERDVAKGRDRPDKHQLVLKFPEPEASQ